jgi:hypothetical protein
MFERLIGLCITAMIDQLSFDLSLASIRIDSEIIDSFIFEILYK